MTYLMPPGSKTSELDPEQARLKRDAVRRAWIQHGAAAGTVTSAPLETTPAERWFLESWIHGQRQLRRMPIEPLPFRIGRAPGLALVLPSQQVSKSHAEFYERDGQLRLRDLKSTNGTFLNHQLIDDVPVQDGDILHFADFEFRIGHEKEDEARGEVETTAVLSAHSLSHEFVEGTRELKELLRQRAVTVMLQPIVTLPARVVAAYEVLGRGTHPGLPESPLELFRIAAGIGAETELSRLFRRKAVELLRERKDFPTLFLNTHPDELEQPGLLESLEELRTFAPHLDLTLEIHESTLSMPEFISWLRMRLSEINIGLAYDDFGAGQARLIELAEAPPHFLKFDRRFVSGIDRAPTPRRRLLSSLVAASRELLVKTIAEGVETPEEAEVCSRVGFTHAQGYLFGRPVPFDQV